MKIKEVKEKIEGLKDVRRQAQTLQDVCLHPDPETKEAMKQMETVAHVPDIRTFYTLCIRLAEGEIRRLEDLIDSTEIRI